MIERKRMPRMNEDSDATELIQEDYDSDATVLLKEDANVYASVFLESKKSDLEENLEKLEDEPRYLKKGYRLNGRYLIDGVVGAGGFGVTYAAWDITLNRRVAVKEYLPGEFSTRMPGSTHVTVYGGEKEEQFQDGLKKYLEESKRLASFRGALGIVQIFDTFTENETAYIVMEFLKGETLAERLERDGKLDCEEAVRIILPILDALETVHSGKLLHRDVAPNNIFLCENGYVKLLDFGAARNVTGTYSKSLTVLYKEGYTAEEQYRSRGEQGPWTDVYSCGATLYRMLSGEVPEGAMERRRNDTLKPLSKMGVQIPENLDAAVMNALNMDIARRTQSAQAMKEEILSSDPVKNHFERVKENKLGQIPRWVFAVAGSACAVLVLLLVLGMTGAVDFHTEGFANLFVPEGKSRMMNVVNLKEEEAKERLSSIKLGMEVTSYKYSNKVQEGRIISQEEKRGSLVDVNSIAHVTVSKGAGEVEVPDMIGKLWTDMKMELEDLCLEYNLTEEKNEEAPGYVIAQGSEAGILMEQGQTVEVTVSKGMGYDRNALWDVQDLTGMTENDAKALLASHGIYARFTSEEYSSDIEEGCVVRQSVPSGTTLHGEEIMELTTSLGMDPEEAERIREEEQAAAEEAARQEEEARANAEETDRAAAQAEADRRAAAQAEADRKAAEQAEADRRAAEEAAAAQAAAAAAAAAAEAQPAAPTPAPAQGGGNSGGGEGGGGAAPRVY